MLTVAQISARRVLPRVCSAGAARGFAEGSPEEVLLVEDRAVGGFAHTVVSGRHRLRGDLMPQAGGHDVGPR